MNINIRTFLKQYKFPHEKVEIGSCLTKEAAIQLYVDAGKAYAETKMRNLMDSYI